jgi:hypothetical protein
VGFVAALPSRRVADCHCTRRRREHGPAVVTFVGLDADQIELHDRDRRRRLARTPGGQRGLFATRRHAVLPGR